VWLIGRGRKRDHNAGKSLFKGRKNAGTCTKALLYEEEIITRKYLSTAKGRSIGALQKKGGVTPQGRGGPLAKKRSCILSLKKAGSKIWKSLKREVTPK